MQGLKRERENDDLMQFMFLAPRKSHVLVPTNPTAVATARALVENHTRLEHYVNQMPFEYLLSLVQGTNTPTAMSCLLQESSYFWYLALRRCSFRDGVNYKQMVAKVIEPKK